MPRYSVRKSAVHPSVPRRYVRGQGAYTVDNGPWANRGASLGSLVGGHYGGPVGRTVGGWLGRRLFHYPAKLFGSGAYTLKRSAIPRRVIRGKGTYHVVDSVSQRIAPQVPVFEKGEDDSITICHKEYLGDIITSSTANTFKIQSFGLNPSDMNTFPWVSNIAQPNYQQYKFDGLVFEFKSFSADALNSTNTALGSVFACINYDYSDASLASRYEVENTDWSASCKPSDNMLIPVECKPKQTGMNGLLYVVNGNMIPVGTDPKTYYLGKLFIGTTGFQGTNVNIGSLYVTYKLRLYKPIMTRPLSNALIASYSRNAPTSAGPLGTSTKANSQSCDSIGLSFTSTVVTISHERLLVGQKYIFLYQCVGDDTAARVAPALALSSGLTATIDFGANIDQTTLFGPRTTNQDSQIVSMICFTVNSNVADQTITLSGAQVPANSTAAVYMFQVCGIPLKEIGFFTPQ